MDTHEDWLAFQAGERETHIHLTCTECGGDAEGNHSWTDGSGEICDKCVDEDENSCATTDAYIWPMNGATVRNRKVCTSNTYKYVDFDRRVGDAHPSTYTCATE